MRNKIKLIGSIVLIICLCGCVEAPEINEDISQEQSGDLTQLRVSVQPHFLSAQLQYIMDYQLDEKAGLDLRLIYSEDGNRQIEDEAIDDWDVATIGGAFVYAIAEDKAILVAEHISTADSNNIYAKRGHEVFDTKGVNPTYPNIHGTSEIVKDKKLLISPNTTSEYIANKWLASIGLPKESVEMVLGNFDSSYEDLIQGEGEYASLTAPFSFMAEDSGYEVVASATDLNIPFYEVIIANSEIYEEKREEVRIFIELILEANIALESSDDRKVDNAKLWYENSEVNDELLQIEYIEKECGFKTYVTPDNYDIAQFGTFAEEYASFLVNTGNMEAENLMNVKDNIDYEIFEEALENVSLK